MTACTINDTIVDGLCCGGVYLHIYIYDTDANYRFELQNVFCEKIKHLQSAEHLSWSSTQPPDISYDFLRTYKDNNRRKQ